MADDILKTLREAMALQCEPVPSVLVHPSVLDCMEREAGTPVQRLCGMPLYTSDQVPVDAAYIGTDAECRRVVQLLALGVTFEAALRQATNARLWEGE
jgi:hypothetical protein